MLRHRVAVGLLLKSQCLEGIGQRLGVDLYFEAIPNIPKKKKKKEKYPL
jgi:hypothetical protein